MRADPKFRSIVSVVKMLRADAAISQLVGSEKIFPLIAPEGTDGDIIVYQRDGYIRQDSKMGIALQRSLFTLIVISVDYDRSLTIAEAAYNVLEGDHPEYGVRIRMENYTDDYIDKKFTQFLQFSIE